MSIVDGLYWAWVSWPDMFITSVLVFLGFFILVGVDGIMKKNVKVALIVLLTSPLPLLVPMVARPPEVGMLIGKYELGEIDKKIFERFLPYAIQQEKLKMKAPLILSGDSNGAEWSKILRGQREQRRSEAERIVDEAIKEGAKR